jgi:hypothetical protein
VNKLKEHQELLTALEPWAGTVPAGFIVDSVGSLVDTRFVYDVASNPDIAVSRRLTTRHPELRDGHNGEGWFELVNWVAAAKEARRRFVMVTLGACFGAQAVGAYRALQILNPMPCRLVLVEADPTNCEWMTAHLRNNGIDPDKHWLVPMAISDRIDPVFFPVGSPGTGAQNCYSTNEVAARKSYVDLLIAGGNPQEALTNLIVFNTTGIVKDLVPGRNLNAEIRIVSAITLKELLGPFDWVDYLESDVQQSEILIFPPFMDLLKQKVRRIHIGTHGQDVHLKLHSLFAEQGWDIVFSYAPNSSFDSPFGKFTTNDGVLTVLNRDLQQE